MDYDRTADELVESWFNGNRMTVCRSIVVDYATKRAAVLAAMVCQRLYVQRGQSETTVFLRILELAE